MQYEKKIFFIQKFIELVLYTQYKKAKQVPVKLNGSKCHIGT